MPPSPSRAQLGLTVTLASMTMALVLVAVAAVVAVVGVSDRLGLDDIERRYGRASTLAVRAALTHHLAPAGPQLAEVLERVQAGRLAVDDHSTLAEYLVDKVRYQPEISFFMYGDQSAGNFAGAWRRPDGAVILMLAAPDTDQGRPREWEVMPGGTRMPFVRDLPSGYDPRVRPWYRLALEHERVAWTEPYLFPHGDSGISAVRALVSPTGDVQGVFAIDFELDQPSAALKSVLEDTLNLRAATMAVVTRAGQPLAYSFQPGDREKLAVVAQALAASPTPPSDLPLSRSVRTAFESSGRRQVAYLQAESVSDTLEMVTVFIVPEDELYNVVNGTQQAAAWVGGLLIVASVVVCILLSRRISQPIALIAADLEAIGRFDLDDRPAPRSFVREVVVVASAVDRMKASLRSFGRYVPRQLVQDVLAGGEEAKLGGESRFLSLYFSDVAEFTLISESMPPSELVTYLGEYLQEMTQIIQGEGGTVDKFIGDGILALFGAPRALPEHPIAACRAALCSQERLRTLRRRWQQLGRQPMRARIGLHAGEVIVGNIGTPERFEYTVTGDAVNLASRLEGLSKVYGTEILASGEMRAATGDAFEWRTLERVAVVGRRSGTMVCELLGERGRVEPSLLQARDLFERGYRAYLRRDFGQAIELFRLAAAARPGDLTALLLASRSEELRQQPPADDWDGVYRATSK